MTRARRLEALASLAPRPPRPSPSYWTDSVNVEPAAKRAEMQAAPSPCRFIKQQQPRLSDEERRPSPLAPRTSRSPGRALASSNRPLHSCPVLPALVLSATLRRLLPPLQLDPNCLASAPVIRFPRCHGSPPWRPPSLRAIAQPPCASQRRVQSNMPTLGTPHCSARLRYRGGAFSVISSQRTEAKPLWVQNPWCSKTAAWSATAAETTRPRTSCPPSEELSPAAAWRARSEVAGEP